LRGKDSRFSIYDLRAFNYFALCYRARLRRTSLEATVERRSTTDGQRLMPKDLDFMILLPPAGAIMPDESQTSEHQTYRRCEGSFLALGDLLPFGQNRAYVDAIYVIRDKDDSAIGWAYKSQTGKWWLQAGPRMAPKDVLRVGADLPANAGERRGSVSPMSVPNWKNLRLVDECH
jgi:hypothetical protein